MRIGAKVPNSGPLPAERGIGAMAATLERVGFESLWVSDHVVMPTTIHSRYPFASDGWPTWPADTPYYDCVVALAVIAAFTSRVDIGTAVMVLPLRHPVILAKQLASLDVISGGRVVLGVGTGWLAEEFEALGVPFGDRRARTQEWIGVLRECWQGRVGPMQGERCTIPHEVIAEPTPVHRLPVLVGGHGQRSLAMAGTLGDGWLAHQSALAVDIEALRAGVEEVRATRERTGLDRDGTRMVLRLIDSAGRAEEIAKVLPAIANVGIDELVVDVDWIRDDGPDAAFSVLEAGCGRG